NVSSSASSSRSSRWSSAPGRVSLGTGFPPHPEPPRRSARMAPEYLGEMPLRLEADEGRDLDQRELALGQYPLGALDAMESQVGVRRQAGRLLEQAGEVKRAHV